MSDHYPHPFPPPWAEAWGDDRYGLWADLLVKGVTQRMRWLAPGRFVMGSPVTEPGHQSEESPQHTVTLTESQWLADTACTQAMWEVVMGSNPSYVTDDPNKPVEMVSWSDVQDFFGALQTHDVLPAGIEAVLPTEAQWEYACRAGTVSAYSFGDTISVKNVNFDHDKNWKKRVDMHQTIVPVKSLPANCWGFYEMHGNVWEWCADSMRAYAVGNVSNPSGPSGAVGDGSFELAVRGGAWRGHFRFERSAQRSHRSRDKRLNLIGFRFALRSKSEQRTEGSRA